MLVERIELEVNALRQIAQNKGYPLVCEDCGIDRSESVLHFVHEIKPNADGRMEMVRKGTFCSPCLENNNSEMI